MAFRKIEDLELVQYVRRNYLIAPAPNATEYTLNATKTIIDPSLGPSKKKDWLQKIWQAPI
jgi:hypothetical protein